MIPKYAFKQLLILLCCTHTVIAGGKQSTPASSLRMGSLASLPRVLEHARSQWMQMPHPEDDDDNGPYTLHEDVDRHENAFMDLDDDDAHEGRTESKDRKKEKEEDPETVGRTPPAMKQRLLQALPEKYHSAIEHDEIKTIARALIYQCYPPRDLLLDFAMLSEDHFLSFRCPNRVFSFALFEGNTSILKKLLASEHIDPTTKFHLYGNNALTLAASNHDLETLEVLLLDGRCDPNQKDRQGYTALITAGDNGCVEIVRALLNDPRTNPNCQNKSGETALLCALKSEHIEAARELLSDRRTNIYLKNNEQRTAPEVALFMQNEAIISLFNEGQLYLAKEKQATRFIAHLFNLKNIPGNYSDYEGCPPSSMMHLLSAQLSHLIEHPFKGPFWKENKSALLAYFSPLIEAWKDLHQVTVPCVKDDICSKQACSISMRHPLHYVSISIWKNWIALGNRGYQIAHDPDRRHLNFPGIYFYQIPEIERLLSSNFISDLLYGPDFSRLQEIQRTEYSRCIHISEEPQLRPNCSYTSGKLDIKAHLFFFVAEAMGVDLVAITNKDDPLWVEVTQEAQKIYRDFATLGRILLFNEYAERYSDENNSDDRALLACMYQAIKKRSEKTNYGQPGYFQVIHLCDALGQEIPILDQLNPAGRAIAEKSLDTASKNGTPEEPQSDNAASWYNFLLESLLTGSA